ncbi:ATP-binding protein [Streptomyces sp. NPDC047079]|uniref:ATP-binding protein n=1 Tax=Streptomyces sp. NPDC047079 TaxID=3154607 RepID=UPI0033F839C0
MRPAERPARDGENPALGGEERAAAHARGGEGVRQEGSAPASPVISAASARAQVLTVVRSHWDAPDRRPAEQSVTDLLLVTSELVSNAIRHGGGLTAFEAAATRDGVRLTVYDRSPHIPIAAFGSGALPVGHDGGGYGWPLIIQLARDIVIERCAEGGKFVSVLVPLRTGSELGG